MTKASIKHRNAKFASTPRGVNKIDDEFTSGKSQVGPFMVGFFVFVVVGSFLFQIIRTATRGSYAE